jgi:Tfp pilus assembly protein PilF
LWLDPRLPTAYCGLGVIYLEQGNALMAAREFRGAVEFDPNYVTAYYYLGLAYEVLGDHAGAIGAFRTALTLAPNSEIGQWIEDKLNELGDFEKPLTRE